MKTLFIDTHLSDINILLFDNFQLIDECHVISEKHNSKFLLPSIKKVCDNNDYDQIIVVNGPGSFTGVRLGVTVAKTLAYCKNIPIKSVTALAIMNYSSDGGNHIFGLSDGNGYYIGEFNNYVSVIDFYYVSNTDFQQLSNNKNIETNVAINYEQVLKSLENKPYENPHGVNPIYIKLIGVENDKKN